MRVSTLSAVFASICVGISAQRLPSYQGQFPNSSSQSSQVTTSSQQLVSCSCSLDGIEIYHTYTGEVQQENQTYYVNIIPYITPQPDGSYVTNEVTVTHNANNSAVTDVGSLSANQAPTWIVSGVTLTYPTTYIENKDLSAQVFTSAISGASACKPADTFLDLDLPPDSATGLIIPLSTSVDLSEPIPWVPALRAYLDSLPGVEAQFASEGGIDFSSCKGSPKAVTTTATGVAPVVKTTVAVLVTSQASPVTVSGPSPAAQQNPSLATSTVPASAVTSDNTQGGSNAAQPTRTGNGGRVSNAPKSTPQTNNNIQVTPGFPFQAPTQSSGQGGGSTTTLPIQNPSQAAQTLAAGQVTTINGVQYSLQVSGTSTALVINQTTIPITATSNGVGDYIMSGLGASTTSTYTGTVSTGAAKREVTDNQTGLEALFGGLLALFAIF